MTSRKLFCELGPVAYRLSLAKERLIRHFSNLFSRERFAAERRRERLPVVVAGQSCAMIKRGPGIEPQLQRNKADNIRLACSRIDGLVINPGESFSFWKYVGKTSRTNGYLDGRVIVNGRLTAGTGGGLCNLANAIHQVVMHTPMTITELHHHSDALAPDTDGVYKPYSAGTSIKYNFLDFRFRNDTDRPVQLLTWCDADTLRVEMLSTAAFPCSYRIVAEDHHFIKDSDGSHYRVATIYRDTVCPRTGQLLNRELKWANRSRVMFDPALIPAELLR